MAQDYQKKFYNEGRRDFEFQEGDMVLINLHSMHLLRSFKGRGQKLLPRFDGPYEIAEKVSKVAYRLRLPASYRGHPVINIAHLKLYTKAQDQSISRPTLAPLRKSFDELQEFEVEQILNSKLVRGPKGRHIRKYKVHWKGYKPKYDTWETRQNLRNAPAALREYESQSHSVFFLSAPVPGALPVDSETIGLARGCISFGLVTTGLV